jgi:phosphohistidine phosphatase
MDLYLVRHAIAENRADGDDDARALSAGGKAKMNRVAEGLRKLKIRPDLILTSPLVRARQTAEILAQSLHGAKVEVLPELAPAGAVVAVIPALRPHARLKAVMLVGHQPCLGELLSLLLTGSKERILIDFKKGGAACIEADLSD